MSRVPPRLTPKGFAASSQWATRKKRQMGVKRRQPNPQRRLSLNATIKNQIPPPIADSQRPVQLQDHPDHLHRHISLPEFIRDRVVKSPNGESICPDAGSDRMRDARAHRERPGLAVASEWIHAIVTCCRYGCERCGLAGAAPPSEAATPEWTWKATGRRARSPDVAGAELGFTNRREEASWTGGRFRAE